MATMNSNQENLYQAAQKFYGDPKGVKETAEKAFNDILREL